MKTFLSSLCVLCVLCVSLPIPASAGTIRNQAATTTTRAALINDGTLASDGTITATATAGAATLSKVQGVITSEALTTAAAAAYTLTLTNTLITSSSIVMCSVNNGTNTQGIPVVGTVAPGSGSAVIKVYNLHASQALNGTLKIAFQVVK